MEAKLHIVKWLLDPIAWLESAIRTLLVLGLAASYMWFQVSVMGNDITFGGDSHKMSQHGR